MSSFPPPENDYPNGVDYLLNIYQENGPIELGGGSIDTSDKEPEPDEVLEEINVSVDEGWNSDLNHFLIDDDEQVQEKVKSDLDTRINR